MLFALLRDARTPTSSACRNRCASRSTRSSRRCPATRVVGVGRDDGKAAGESSAILFRARGSTSPAGGKFWFSDTPEIPGSKTWGNRITRIATWARFVDRDGSAFWHYNLHLDHESQPSREKSTALLLSASRARVPTEPVVVTGDFNVGEANPAIHTLVGAPGRAAARGAAVRRHLPRAASRRQGGRHVHGFESGATAGDKIDYVLVQPGTGVLSAAIVRTGENNHYPSDHFPVTARIAFTRAAAAP